MSNETVVCEVKPSWKLAVTKLIAVSVLAIIVAVAVGIWVEGQSPVLWFFVVLVPLGLLAVFSVWWMRLGTLLTVTPTRCVLRKGILSRSTSELRHEDIRNIQMNQGIIERLLTIGSLGLSTAGQSEIEIVISGIDRPERVRDLIEECRA